MKFFATAPYGLSTALAAELRQLGAEKLQPGRSGVTFEGDLEIAYRACLWSRLANRILLPLTTVQAPTADWLYDAVKEIRWERHLHSSGSLAIDISSTHAAITHSQYALLKAKDAIIDRFRDRFGERPSIDTELPDLRIHLHLRGSQARIAIDLSGGSLHRRGYRSERGSAPLRENLAAGLLVLAGWPDIAADGGTLLDPMCGAGTLPIEAAMMAADIAPGLQRKHFGLLYWRRHQPELWETLLHEARQRRDAGLDKLPPLLGFDSDAAMIEIARANAERAGLEKYIDFQARPLGPGLRRHLPDGVSHGLLIANPPYGERLGEISQLRHDYAHIGRLLREELPDFHGSIFTANPELAAQLQLPVHSSVALHNGPLACQLFNHLPASAAGEAPPLSPGATALANRLRKNLRHLGRWAQRNQVDCYRLYDADLPEYALAIDLYQGQRLWVHVQEYQAPSRIDPEQARQRLQEALELLPKALAIPPEQLFVKLRRQQKGRSQYRRMATEKIFHEVREGDCRLLVNFTDYLDTGLFLDHRPLRLRIGQEAAGKHMLNLFAYTGTASVHAAVGGAASTTTVDMSATYLDWAHRNLELNGISGAQHRLIRADCLEWLEQTGKKRHKYDLIFLDPPTFSNSTRMEGTFEVQRDHVWLIATAMRLLQPDGVLYFSNNFRRFRMDTAALQEYALQDITRETIDEDFRRNPRIHQCWTIRHAHAPPA